MISESMIVTILRSALGFLARSLPSNAPEFIYEKILRGPLRSLFNWGMLLIIPAQIKIPEGALMLNTHDPIISGMLTLGIFEPYETILFREALQEGMVVVDIGANIGLFSVIAATRVGESGSVIAFEPEPENYALLKKNIEKNKLKNVTLYQKAVADKPGQLTLHIYDANKGKHSLVKDVTDAPGFNSDVLVEVVQLDTVLGEKHIRPNIIKMDIEGAESLALLGMESALASCTILFMEFTPDSVRKVGHDPETVLKKLEKQGFGLFRINEKERKKERVMDYKAFIESIPPAHAANLYGARFLNTTNL